jgi:hypothetical protein
MLSMVSDAPTPPLAAHGDAVERAQDDEHRQVGREAGGEFQDRVGQHVGHQGRPPAEAVGDAAEEERAERAHRQRERDRPAHREVAGRECRGDIAQHEHHDEEVERVERPAEIAGGDNVALLAGRFVHARSVPGRGCARRIRRFGLRSAPAPGGD